MIRRDHENRRAQRDALPVEIQQLVDSGYCVIPLLPDSKRPAIAWKEFQLRKPTFDELLAWFSSPARFNVGVVAGAISGGLFIRDIDDKAAAADFFRQHQASLRTVVETLRGFHAYFRFAGGRNRQGNLHDDRGQGGYAVGVPSAVAGWGYRYLGGHGLVQPAELCELPLDLRPLPTLSTSRDFAEPDLLRRIARAQAYADRLPPSVSGQRGHDAAFKFAARMVRRPPHGFDLTVEQAWAIALAFNRRCQPPWAHKDLLRKLHEAKKLDEALR